MINQEFGARLRELRKQAGLGQRELANRIGVNFTYLSKIENGAMPPPSEKVINRLAEALNVDKDELMALAGRIPADIAQILKSQKTWQFLRSGRTQRKLRVVNRKERVSIMKNLVNYKRLPRAAIATLLVAAVAASLWFASPTQAVTVTIPDLPATMYENQIHSFSAQIVINTNERIPISKLRLDISGPTPRWAEFNAAGTFLSGSSSISLTRTAVPYYGSGTRSGYGYGYQPTIGYGYFTGNWAAGYGYGYGYTGSPTSQATYQVTLDTSGMTLGSYTVRFSVITGPGTQSFTSTLRDFTLSPAAEDNGGVLPGFGPSAVSETGVTKVSGVITSTGKFTEEVTAKSKDKKVELTIEKSTVGLTKSKTALSKISVLEMAAPPAPPADTSIVGLTYDLGPDGATFDPPISLTFTYDPSDIPDGVNEEDLVIAIWDESTGEWVVLEGAVVDPVANTVTVPVSHFTAFTVIAPATPPAPPVPAPPAPAPVPAPPAMPKPVTPQPAPALPSPAPAPAPSPTPPPESVGPSPWLISGGIIGAVVIAGLLVYFLWWRRRMA